MFIHCAYCGKYIKYLDAWRSRLVKVLVCDSDCINKIEIKYCEMILDRNKSSLERKNNG